MELTNKHIEELKKAAKIVEYGSVTFHISPTSGHLDIEINKRIRIEAEPAEHKKNFGSFHERKGCGLP